MAGANPITERATMTMFYEALMQGTAMAAVDALCTPAFRSDQDSEDYAWLGQVPRMKEVVGSKSYTQLRQTAWTLQNKTYQAGLDIPEKHVLYDKTDQVEIRVGELADGTNNHWWDLLATKIVGGAAGLCYDGDYFFGDAHVEGGSGTQDNNIDSDISAAPVTNHGSTTAPSAGEMVHAIMQGINQIIAFKDDKGEYCNENLNRFLVMAPSTLSIAAMSALRARSIDGGDSNILIEQDGFMLSVLFTPRLSTWTDKFAIFATQGRQKPFIRQQRIPNQAPAGYDVEGIRYWTLWTDSEYCRLNGKVLVNAESERALDYGDWKKGCLVTLV